MEQGFRPARRSNDMPALVPDADLVLWLRRFPERLEPGLTLAADSLDLGPELGLVPLFGSDVLGRPVFVLVHSDPGGPSLERLLALARAGGQDRDLLASRFARPQEPRLLLVGPGLEAAATRSLAQLLPVLVARCFRLEAGGTSVRPEPRLVLLEASGADPAPLLGPLPPEVARLGRRLLAAAAAIVPPLEWRGEAWPLLLAGRRGPCASLHRDGSRLVLARGGQTGPLAALELHDDDAVDLAIDFLLREQRGAVPAAESA